MDGEQYDSSGLSIGVDDARWEAFTILIVQVVDAAVVWRSWVRFLHLPQNGQCVFVSCQVVVERGFEGLTRRIPILLFVLAVVLVS